MDDKRPSPDNDFSRIAIVGMACRFGPSRDGGDLWGNMVDAADVLSGIGRDRGRSGHQAFACKPEDRIERVDGLDHLETYGSCIRRILADAVTDAGGQLNTRDIGFVVGGIHGALQAAIFSDAVAAIGFQHARTVTYAVGSACLNLVEIATHELLKRDHGMVVVGDFQADSHEGVDEPIPGQMGVLVLKHLVDAERNGDRVYAVIRAVGASAGREGSDKHASLAGMQRALSRAYGLSGISPQTIGFLEIEGSDARLPDGAEIDAWLEFVRTYQNRQTTRESKSLRVAAGDPGTTRGMATIIKATLALYHRVLPAASICCCSPLTPVADADCYVSDEKRPWIQSPKQEPRRAGVHSFDADGVNIHMILEEYSEVAGHGSIAPRRDRELIVLEAESVTDLQAAIRRLRDYTSAASNDALRDIAFTCNSSLVGMPERISVVASSVHELGKRLETAQATLGRDRKPSPRDRQDIHYVPDVDLRGAKVALLFPGAGSQYINMFSDLCVHFPQARAVFDLAESAIPGLKSLIFPPPSCSDEERTAAEARLAGADLGSVIPANTAMLQMLESVSLAPSMVAGHSIGELVALIAAGVIELEEFNSTIDRLGAMSRKVADDPALERVELLIVGAPREKVELFLPKMNRRVYIVADNCPHQVILLVDGEEEAAIRQEMLANGFLTEKAPFRGVYHTPFAQPIVEYFREYLASLKIRPPSIPIYSTATAQLYPEKPLDIVETMAQSFARPILFRETIEAMYEAGARIFVECGPRSNLSTFVKDTLSGRPHITIPTDQLNSPGLASVQNALGALAAAHVPINLAPLYRRREARRLVFGVREAEVRGTPGGDHPSSVERHARIKERHERRHDEAVVLDTRVAPPFSEDDSPVLDRGGLLDEHFARMRLFLAKHETMMKRAICSSERSRSTRTTASGPKKRNHLQ